MWHDFQHGRAAALELDALRHTHPIYCEVRTPPRSQRELRPHHLREGRVGGAHARALPGRRELPQGRARATSAGTGRATPSRPTSGGRSPRPRASRSSRWRAPGSSRRATRCVEVRRAEQSGRSELQLRAGALRREPARARPRSRDALADPLGRPRGPRPRRAREGSCARLVSRAREQHRPGPRAPRASSTATPTRAASSGRTTATRELAALLGSLVLAHRRRAHGTRRPPVGAGPRGRAADRRASSTSPRRSGASRTPTCSWRCASRSPSSRDRLIPDAAPGVARRPSAPGSTRASERPSPRSAGTRRAGESDESYACAAPPCSGSWAASADSEDGPRSRASAAAIATWPDRRAIDANLADGVVSLAARVGDAARHRRFVEAAAARRNAAGASAASCWPWATFATRSSSTKPRALAHRRRSHPGRRLPAGAPAREPRRARAHLGVRPATLAAPAQAHALAASRAA